MSLLFDPTTNRTRRRYVVHKKKRPVPAKRTPDFYSLVDSIGELPVDVELPIEYDKSDNLEIDTRPVTITFSMLAHERLHADEILQRINESRPYAVPFDNIVIYMRTSDDTFELVWKDDIAWDSIDLAQCYVKFRYPDLILIRLSPRVQ